MKKLKEFLEKNKKTVAGGNIFEMAGVGIDLDYFRNKSTDSINWLMVWQKKVARALEYKQRIREKLVAF